MARLSGDTLRMLVGYFHLFDAYALNCGVVDVCATGQRRILEGIAVADRDRYCLDANVKHAIVQETGWYKGRVAAHKLPVLHQHEVGRQALLPKSHGNRRVFIIVNCVNLDIERGQVPEGRLLDGLNVIRQSTNVGPHPLALGHNVGRHREAGVDAHVPHVVLCLDRWVGINCGAQLLLALVVKQDADQVDFDRLAGENVLEAVFDIAFAQSEAG